MASSVHELVTSVGGWPPRFAGTSPCRAVGCPHRCTGGDGTAPPRPPAPPFSSWAACELRKVACPQGRRGVAGDLVPAVTSAPGHRQFNLTVFRPAASSGLGAVPSLWNKCQNCHPCHPVLLCVSIALRSRGWTRVGELPPILPTPSLHPHPSSTGLAALVGFAQGDGHSGTRGAGMQPQTSGTPWGRCQRPGSTLKSTRIHQKPPRGPAPQRSELCPPGGAAEPLPHGFLSSTSWARAPEADVRAKPSLLLSGGNCISEPL